MSTIPFFRSSPAAHRVPPELFKKIVEDVVGKSVEHGQLSTEQSKRTLSQCSLVCAYWAKYTRPFLFQFLDLYGQDDVRTLFEFAGTTTKGMNIAEYVNYLSVQITVPDPDPPWMHLVLCSLCGVKFPDLQTFFIGVSGAAEDAKQKQVDATNVEHTSDDGEEQSEPHEPTPDRDLSRAIPHSLFYNLPRTLPITIITWSLTFTDLRFATFAHAVSFLASCLSSRADSAAAHLHLTNVSWDDADVLAPEHRPAAFAGVHRRWRRRLSRIAVAACSAVWPCVWLIVSTERLGTSHAVPPLFVDGAEMCRVASLVRDVVDTCQCALCEGETRYVTIEVDETAQACFKVEAASHLLEFKLSLGGFIDEIVLDLAQAKDASAAELVSPQSLQFDWTMLDARVKAFDATLETFSVRVPGTAYDVYKPHVREQVRETEATGRLDVVQIGNNQGTSEAVK
ncbi:hypothetical protein PsYK624_033710 [Phanerochaete sordida]|uniref:Uncharacterized protein n=1 Tax=Phanerochaete sordida TaxID=48140 RepID=A0A9P3G1I0_9APHY|nr:hypothetical protein PsYK624_033710 [Phanerochaete sordida]